MTGVEIWRVERDQRQKNLHRRLACLTFFDGERTLRDALLKDFLDQAHLRLALGLAAVHELRAKQLVHQFDPVR